MEAVKVSLKLGVLANQSFDFTQELLHSADLISQEMRGNVKAGMDVHGAVLTPNKQAYAKIKIKKLGHARPLIAENRSLVTPASYFIKKISKNFVRITLPGQHPKSNLRVGQIAYIHNYGLGHNPVREIAGVTAIAVKRVMAYMNDRVARLFK